MFFKYVEFKEKRLAIIRPLGKSTCGIRDIKRARSSKKLRLEFRVLNDHSCGIILTV